MLQYSTHIPLRINTVLIADEVSAEVFVDIDINDEPFVSEIWIENLDGRRPLVLSKGTLFDQLCGPAWSAVADDVKDDLLEAAE